MCTLIIARDVLGPNTVLLGANRDERASRPSLPPGILSESPRVVGGRDQVAGGTWLALREHEGSLGAFAVALLNRRDPQAHDPPADRRSRGLLTLDVARAPRTAGPMLEHALERVRQAHYAPFSLVYASAAACWMIAHEGDRTRSVVIEPGWHVLTHMDLDDPHEPRAAHLLARLDRERPQSLAAAETLMIERLRSHSEDGGPPVCLHQGAMTTVSSSVVWFGPEGLRYLHAEGRPCQHEYRDYAWLLAPAARPEERT